jgi:hypothetical protein
MTPANRLTNRWWARWKRRQRSWDICSSKGRAFELKALIPDSVNVDCDRSRSPAWIVVRRNSLDGQVGHANAGVPSNKECYW